MSKESLEYPYSDTAGAWLLAIYYQYQNRDGLKCFVRVDRITPTPSFFLQLTRTYASGENARDVILI